jgi:hypothetical protein
MLERRELSAAGDRLAGELGKAFVEAPTGSTIEGRLLRRIDLTSGRYALIEKSHEFTLVPWRAVLERQVGNHVSGLVREDAVTWRFGRDRSGPQIG